MKDKLVAGSLAGVVGATVSGIIAIIVNVSGISSVRMLFLDSAVFLPNSLALTIAGNIYGFAIHIIIGGIIGAAFMYFFRYTGEDYLFFKGLFLGGFAWLAVGGILGNILDIPIKDTLLDNTIFALCNLAFGVVTVYMANYLRKNEL